MQGRTETFTGRVSAAVETESAALKHIVPELDESVDTGVSPLEGAEDER